MGMQGNPKDQLPKMSQVMKEYGHLALPIIFLVYMLFFSGRDGYHGCVLYDRIHDHRGAVQKEYEMTFQDILDAMVERRSLLYP